jgi:hypothetical protein
MKIREELERVYSKQLAIKVATYVGADEELFSELMILFFQEDYRMVQRASAVLSVCVDNYPFLITPYLDRLVANLKNDIPDVIKRNTVRILQTQDIPDHLLGAVADSCFQFLGSKNEAVAIQAFSMTVLLNVVRKVPELGSELKWLIEEQLPYASAGFVSRGKKVLNELRKLGY